MKNCNYSSWLALLDRKITNHHIYSKKIFSQKRPSHHTSGDGFDFFVLKKMVWVKKSQKNHFLVMHIKIFLDCEE